MLMEKQYGIKLANPAEGKAIFKSVASMADYISKNRKKSIITLQKPKPMM